MPSQDRLSIPQETELKAAYISLAPNDERPHPDYGSVPEEHSALAPATYNQPGPLRTGFRATSLSGTVCVLERVF